MLWDVLPAALWPLADAVILPLWDLCAACAGCPLLDALGTALEMLCS